MELSSLIDRLRSGAAAKFPSEANTLAFAQALDGQDSLRHLREEFIIPTKASLRKKALNGRVPGMLDIYFPASLLRTSSRR